jgi:hypothetical protein
MGVIDASSPEFSMARTATPADLRPRNPVDKSW